MRRDLEKIAFRVDASGLTGSGHFVRCLTLAEALRKQGAKTRFVCRYLPANLRDELATKGHECVLLSSADGGFSGSDGLAHTSWLGVAQDQDAIDSIQSLFPESWDWLVVDHYALDSRWETQLRHVAKRILAIDDIADRSHDCDLLLDQNLYSDMETRYVGKVPARCLRLLGPRYALLREEFSNLRRQAEPKDGPVRRLLVFFGGVDTSNFTGKVVETLSKMAVSNLRVDVVVGAQHPCREEIVVSCAEAGFISHVQTNRMQELMLEADLAIGAGGSATWERCCLGLPALVFCTAENQKRQIEDAARHGLLYTVEAEGDLGKTIARHFQALAENINVRRIISRKGMRAVDGRGVSRVIANMDGGDIQLRRATKEDAEDLFLWRNHSTMREASRNTEVMDRQGHHEWLGAILADSSRALLIGQIDDTPIGVVRFDLRNDEAEISIYLVPDQLDSGFGRPLLRSAENWLATNLPDVCRIAAHVRDSNERSRKFFLSAGYRIASADYLKELH